MATIQIADPWEAMRPPFVPNGIWLAIPEEESGHARHWRMYLGALQLDLFAPLKMAHIWLLSAAPFADEEIVGVHFSPDEAKVAAQAILQRLLHQHIVLMDGSL